MVHTGTVQWQLRQDGSAAVVKLCYKYMHTLVYTQQRHAVRTSHASLAAFHADVQKDSVPCGITPSSVDNFNASMHVSHFCLS